MENNQLEFARNLRKNMTPQERHLWYDFLRGYPIKIYKQKIISPYIVDFCCTKAKLIIEIDGSQHFEENGKSEDAKRTAFLESLGYTVIRFSNYEINTQFVAVCEQIDNLIQKRLPF